MRRAEVACPARRPAARCRRCGEIFGHVAAGAARRAPPSRRDLPGWRGSGSNRRSPAARAACSRSPARPPSPAAIMKPELSPGSGVEERRQAETERGIDQHRDAPLGDRADLAERQRDHVGGKGHRLGVEIAAGDDLAGLGKHQRIVGDAVRLDRQRARGLRASGRGSAHHLRLAAQAIGILHALVAFEMRLADSLPSSSARSAAAAVDLARDGRATPGCRGSNGAVGAHRRIDRQRAGDQRGAAQRARRANKPARA